MSNSITIKTESPIGFKETKLGWIPEDWNEQSINDLMAKKHIIGQQDGNHGALYPSKSEFVDSGIPYLSANNFSGNYVDVKSAKKLSIERSRKFKKGIAKNGDILFSHNATVGPVALLKTDLDFVILSTTLTYYRLNNNLLNSMYFLFAFQSEYFRKQYSKVMG
jgi:type I restriction enzyme S subunit